MRVLLDTKGVFYWTRYDRMFIGHEVCVLLDLRGVFNRT